MISVLLLKNKMRSYQKETYRGFFNLIKVEGSGSHISVDPARMPIPKSGLSWKIINHFLIELYIISDL